MSEPTVKVKRGLPDTVTDSEKTIVNVGVSDGMYVLLDGAATEEMVGTV